MPFVGIRVNGAGNLVSHLREEIPLAAVRSVGVTLDCPATSGDGICCYETRSGLYPRLTNTGVFYAL